MQYALNAKINNPTAKKTNVIDTFTLGPGQSTKVPLGVFEAHMPQPVFEIEYEPEAEAGDGVAAALERVDKGDEYWLVYFFQNFSDDTFHISVKERYTEI